MAARSTPKSSRTHHINFSHGEMHRNIQCRVGAEVEEAGEELGVEVEEAIGEMLMGGVVFG